MRESSGVGLELLCHIARAHFLPITGGPVRDKLGRVIG